MLFFHQQCSAVFTRHQLMSIPFPAPSGFRVCAGLCYFGRIYCCWRATGDIPSNNAGQIERIGEDDDVKTSKICLDVRLVLERYSREPAITHLSSQRGADLFFLEGFAHKQSNNQTNKRMQISSNAINQQYFESPLQKLILNFILLRHTVTFIYTE